MIKIFGGLESTSAALAAERVRMDVVGQNIANAQVTRGADGQPYRRQQVVFEAVLASAQGRAGSPSLPAVSVARVEGDSREPRLVYRPGHPDADGTGMVAMPNVNVHEEMVDMIAATRAFEANLAVLKTARSMAMQTLGIGKR
ncbi:MAG: flagellar basal body rod protein FlgC [Verrucomicrobiae bacterium]|nr:flagellar basal body rod protein FlgC [Verrucomicrobiae bacterium]